MIFFEIQNTEITNASGLIMSTYLEKENYDMPFKLQNGTFTLCKPLA